jgi:hypothetical protein
VTGKFGQAAFHVPGLEHHFIVFGFEPGGHGFGFESFVKPQFNA